MLVCGAIEGIWLGLASLRTYNSRGGENVVPDSSAVKAGF